MSSMTRSNADHAGEAIQPDAAAFIHQFADELAGIDFLRPTHSVAIVRDVG